MKNILTLTLCLCLAGALSPMPSCVKKNFDAPPDETGYDPKIRVSTTIAELQQMQQGAALNDSIIISGVVVMDDRSGNYFKSIVIQDETGGIQILLDQSNLYNDYPAGRKVYVKCGGLFLGNYGQNIQLGYTPDATGGISNIPFIIIADHIVKASYPNPVIPDTLTLNELSNPNTAGSYLNKLVAVKNVEFSRDELRSSYAQPASLLSATNHTVNDCVGGSITLRTSGYARFQPAIIPEGNGIITGIYTRFNNTPQLFIRDTSDVQFNNERCMALPDIFSDGFNDLNNWNAVNVLGDQVWHTENYGNPQPCAVMKGYDGGNHENEDWLITRQALNLSGFNTILFSVDYAGNYNGDPLKCLISTDYSGSGNPNNATWTELGSFMQNNFVFTPIVFDLSAYSNQEVYITFRYTSSESDGATWEIDNIKVSGQ